MVNQNNQIKISAETRRTIFNKIMSHADFMGVFQGGNYEDQNIVDFLKMIWDLPMVFCLFMESVPVLRGI